MTSARPPGGSKKQRNPTNSTDWSALHRRLANVQKRLDLGWAPDAATTKKILAMRARNLAVEPVAATSPGNDIEFLEFSLGEARFGIGAADIREVTTITELLPVPGTPSFVAGIVNLRGHIVSVLDLKVLLQLPADDNSSNKIILIGDDSKLVGILANFIGSLQLVGIATLQSGLPTLAGQCEQYLAGVTADRKVILDAKALLSDRNIIVHMEV